MKSDADLREDAKKARVADLESNLESVVRDIQAARREYFNRSVGLGVAALRDLTKAFDESMQALQKREKLLRESIEREQRA